MICLKSVSKEYDGNDVINNISISLMSNKIYGLIGKNGIGKTTLLKLMTGLSKPTSGSVTKRAHCRIGCYIESNLYPELTINQNLKIRMRTMNVNESNDVIEFLNKVDVWKAKDKKIRTLSLGMTQLVGLAFAFIGSPNVIILDEPFNGLDPINLVEARCFIEDYVKKDHKLIVISSHDLSGLEKIANSFILLDNGEVLEEFEALDNSESSLEEMFEIRLSREA